MVALISALRRRRPSVVVIECRHCGTTVDGSREACPTCGTTGFAEYELPA